MRGARAGVAMLNRVVIERFVVDVLGCGCPPEVFAEVEIERNRPAVAGAPIDARIDVGHRLLIYVVAGAALSESAPQLAALVAAGQADRDAYQFNRFRLVVVCADCAASERMLRPLFDRLASVDERTHLHIVAPDQLAALTTA